jgi:hypothetical protein
MNRDVMASSSSLFGVNPYGTLPDFPAHGNQFFVDSPAPGRFTL